MAFLDALVANNFFFLGGEPLAIKSHFCCQLLFVQLFVVVRPSVRLSADCLQLYMLWQLGAFVATGANSFVVWW